MHTPRIPVPCQHDIIAVCFVIGQRGAGHTMSSYRIVVNDVYNRRKVELTVDGSSTVCEVKEKLIAQLDDVSLADMRLIYSGKICDNSKTATQLFGKMDATAPLNLHLIVSAKTAPDLQRHQSEPAASKVAPPKSARTLTSVAAPALAPPTAPVPVAAGKCQMATGPERKV